MTTYLNLALEEARSAEASGKWRHFLHLYFNAWRFQIPIEELDVLRKRVQPLPPNLNLWACETEFDLIDFEGWRSYHTDGSRLDIVHLFERVSRQIPEIYLDLWFVDHVGLYLENIEFSSQHSIHYQKSPLEISYWAKYLLMKTTISPDYEGSVARWTIVQHIKQYPEHFNQIYQQFCLFWRGERGIEGLEEDLYKFFSEPDPEDVF